jgi:hypothetical protein
MGNFVSRECERRNGRRYMLSLPVSICTPGSPKPVLQNGHTRDISGRSLYCIVNRYLLVGARVELIVTLLGEVDRKATVSLRARGRIVRIDKPLNNDPKSMGIATVIESYTIFRSQFGRNWRKHHLP